MSITGSDVKVAPRQRHLFSADTVLTLRTAEYVTELDMWAFWFNDSQGLNAGILWEDELQPGVADRLKKHEQA